ncbi:phage tail tape measure protein [Acinetobacter sp. SEK570]|uniref:phage tail tape measure protein n=1 Tax=unclassified Acinetobacter TaxID=196816 RepID=UPI00399EEEEC
MTASTVQLRLQIVGQQAQQQMQRLNLNINQGQQQQKNNLNQILRTQNSINASVQQGGRYGQQQLRTGQSMVQTNRLLAQLLQQQQRSSSLISQQLRQQERSYQVQVNALRQQVREAERLRQQLQQAGNAQRDATRGAGGGNALSTTAAIAGGTYAAGMIGSNYLKDPREYMKQISLATDTVLAGQKMPISEFNGKVAEMEGFVRNSTVVGGATPQQMVQALNTLTASNVYDFKELKDVMLQVSRTAFASGADSNDVAMMAVAQRNFGLTDLTRANDQAMKAGQLGSFELRDMARYMPDLLTQGKNAGYIGENGYKDLLVMMQLSKKTAGTAEGAAVNLSDLLGSFSQYHLGLSFAKHIKVDEGDPIAAYGVSKKRKGFDWTTYAANMREKGVGEVEAAALLMNRQMEKSTLYREYRDKAQKAMSTGDNALYLENVQAATQIAAQSEIGKIFHNKQALMAFMGITMNMEKGGFKEYVEQGVNDSVGAVQMSHERQAAQEYGKDNSFDTARFNARVENYNSISGWLGDLKQGLADYAASNIDVAAAASAAVVGLTAVGAAGGIAALAMGSRAGAVGAGAAGAAGAGAAGTIAKGAGVAAVGYLGFEAFKPMDDSIYGKIASFFGASEERPDFFQMAMEKSKEQQAALEEQNQKMDEQNQLSKDLSNKLSTLITVTQQNKPVINMGGGGLMEQITQHAQTEQKRHGVDLLTYGQK